MKHELIGKKVEIKYHNKTFRGEVVDETKNTICLKSKNQKKKVLKNAAQILFDGKKIDGNTIKKRPQDRIKSC
ncbi:ribonuclease P protein subunit [archaeon]|jgi:RNase P/RNase MRP subunit p29|nr:ribonuclease P protein subunit [archaeon]MBT4272473.1 ribonuclease P protein subunit [archaeon]MBT4460571.1 ribonuclease P protein subunit [archaeon]MBT4857839.1 ribonuclease P protein subunit [archaeon]MBT5423146.1 ribonuclease P protein subunit [archaeon]